MKERAGELKARFDYITLKCDCQEVKQKKMKSNYIGSKSEYRRLAYEQARTEIKKITTHECPRCIKSVGYQAIATVLWVLHRDFGWGEKRLNRLKGNVEGEFSLMEGVDGMAGFDYNGNDCVRFLKEIGVDVEASDYG